MSLLQNFDRDKNGSSWNPCTPHLLRYHDALLNRISSDPDGSQKKYHTILVTALFNLILASFFFLISPVISEIYILFAPCFGVPKPVRIYKYENTSSNEDSIVTRGASIFMLFLNFFFYVVLALDTVMALVLLLGVTESRLDLIKMWISFTVVTSVVKIVIGSIKVFIYAVAGKFKILAAFTGLQYCILVGTPSTILYFVLNYKKYLDGIQNP